MTADTTTQRTSMASTIISKVCSDKNKSATPITHIMIKTTGNKYLIINIHVLPTLNEEYSFKVGKIFFKPYARANMMH